jgi:23S rRNA pseudoU1915 N3-methylase RlmH
LAKSYKILLSAKEENISSAVLASKISALGLSGISDIAIIIGTALPHDEALALSPMDRT